MTAQAEFDGGDSIIQGRLLTMAEDFEDIRKTTKGVSDEDFFKTVRFCFYISEGKSKVDAYCAAQGIDLAAKTKVTHTMAAALVARKYTGEILNRMLAGNHILMADKHLMALNEMFEIGMEKGNKTRDRIDALDKFSQLTKKPEAIKIDVDTTLHIGREMATKIDSLTKTLAASGGMVDRHGEIIDTVVLD